MRPFYSLFFPQIKDEQVTSAAEDEEEEFNFDLEFDRQNSGSQIVLLQFEDI